VIPLAALLWDANAFLSTTPNQHTKEGAFRLGSSAYDRGYHAGRIVDNAVIVR